MIKNDRIVEEILKIVSEAANRKYDEWVLKMDLDRYVDSIIHATEEELDEAYREGKLDRADEIFEKGRKDGYDEGYEDGYSACKAEYGIKE